MKPFRLINSSELAMITEHLTLVINQWNQRYSATPVTPTLTLPSKGYTINSTWLIQASGQHIAIVENDYLSSINHTLFGENNACFNATSNELFLKLLNQLFKTTCEITHADLFSPGWIYPGSTCLRLTLTCQQSKIDLILNPDWVYQLLSPPKIANTNVYSLDEALTKQNVALNVELLPTRLPIKQLLNLQVGDVITTDHPITKPLTLTQNNHLVAAADLGQSTHYKSITLRGSHEHHR
jgi:hypothetical protein